jgi:hypothetical protein
LEVTAFIAVLVALVIGFALGRYRTHVFQNRGEGKVVPRQTTRLSIAKTTDVERVQQLRTRYGNNE